MLSSSRLPWTPPIRIVIACVLTCCRASAGPVFPCLWQNGVITHLPSSFLPYSINNSNEVIGDQGMVWANGGLTTLSPLLGYVRSYLAGLNNLGQIVGASSDGVTSEPTVWSGIVPFDLALAAGFTGGGCIAINTSGQVVGVQSIAASEFAFLWASCTLTNLGPL